MEENHHDWNDLPSEVLGIIFERLTNHGKLAFLFTSLHWRNAVDSVVYWKKLSIEVDVDLEEPSILFLTQRYYKYLQTLELGWHEHISKGSEYSSIYFNNIVKRVTRLLTLLYARFVQLKHLVLFEWEDTYSLRKLGYLLTRFIKRQYQLETIVLQNANLYDRSFSHILTACVKSTATIKCISLHFDTDNCQRDFDCRSFINCMSMFDNLEVLTIDCWIFFEFFYELQIGIEKLKVLNLYLCKPIRIYTLLAIEESQWEMFPVYFPNAIVNMLIERPMKDSLFKLILQTYYPLVSFTWNYNFDKEISFKDYCQCIERLATLQANTIENVSLTLPLIKERNLEKQIRHLLGDCQNIKSIKLNNVELVQNRNRPAKSPVQFDIKDYRN